MNAILEEVKEYYRQLANKEGMKTGACACAPDAITPEVRAVLPLIADEITERFYGCGSPLPPLLEGATVLDLGCGTGRDVYVASKLVGEQGLVIGVDMTEEQLAVARKYEDAQCVRFGYARPNVRFRLGYIEDLAAIGIADDSVDVVLSNCVINLSPAKERVFREIFRVLKPGGELYFSDVFADRRIPEALAADLVLRGECISGALYTEDFRRVMQREGFTDFRYMSTRPLDLGNVEVESKVGFANFTESTIRAFKLDGLEDICEDYGQVARYLGTIPGHPHAFDLDDHHRFFTGKPMLVCGNTADMLTRTRYAKAFEVTGDHSVHYGAFNCAPPPAAAEPSAGSCCC